MTMLPRLKSAVDAIGERVERIRLYQSFVLYADAHRLPPSARRRLGLQD